MKNFARNHPVWTFLLINFAWTWLFWLAAVPFRDQPLLVMGMVIVGGFGPAIGGILALGLKSGQGLGQSPKMLAVMMGASMLMFTFISLRYLAGNIPDYDILFSRI